MTKEKPGCSYCDRTGYSWPDKTEPAKRICFACLRQQRDDYRALAETLRTAPTPEENAMSKDLPIEERLLRQKVEAFLRDPNRSTTADVVLCLISYHDLYFFESPKEAKP